MTIGFIGAGHMGGAMLRGLAAADFKPALRVFDADPARTAALAAELALGRDLKSAVAGAKAYVHRAIATSYLVGRDCGVLGWGVDHG